MKLYASQVDGVEHVGMHHVATCGGNCKCRTPFGPPTTEGRSTPRAMVLPVNKRDFEQLLLGVLLEGPYRRKGVHVVMFMVVQSLKK